MRVLVTGGAGFIGSEVVAQLKAAGHQPFVVDDLSTGFRENVCEDVPLFVADVCDDRRMEEVFDEVRPEAVCHQAAQMSVSRSVREPDFDAQVNLLGLLRVLKHAVRCRVAHFVFASSGGVLYGDVFEPTSEDAPCAPVSPYGISKWAGEQYLRFYAEEHGLSSVALRYSNVYGPRQNPHGEAGVVAIFCQKMLAGEQAVINGDGRSIRDYVFVDDVARANVLALQFGSQARLGNRSRFRALNIGTGVGTDVNQLAAMIRTACEKVMSSSERPAQVPPARHGPPRPGDLRSNLVSAQRAEETLGWAPAVSLQEGLRRTVTWFAERRPTGDPGAPQTPP